MKLESHLEGLGLDSWNLSLKTHKAILVRRFKDEAVAKGWDLAKVGELYEVI